MLPKPVHLANELLAFLLELVALVLLAVWGFRIGDNTAVHILLGIGAPALMIVVWGTYCAPRARVKLPLPGVLAVKTAVFAAATAAGYAAGWHGGAIAFGVVALANMLLAGFDREALMNQARQEPTSDGG